MVPAVMKEETRARRQRQWLAGGALALAAVVCALWWLMRTKQDPAAALDTPGIVVADSDEVTRSRAQPAGPKPMAPLPSSSASSSAPASPSSPSASATLPAMPPCPENRPADGSACNLPAGTAQTCGYGTGTKARVCICEAAADTDRRWHCQGTESVFVGECPKKQPKAHSPCPSQGRTCEFEEEDEDGDDREQAEGEASERAEAKEPKKRRRREEEEQGELLCVCDLTTGWSCARALERGGK
jgi:hypothetical protein